MTTSLYTGCRLLGIGLAVAFLLPPAASAKSRKVNLRLQRSVELPELGIRFRPFKGGELSPVPAASAFTYRNATTGEVFETYSPGDLWRREQSWVQFLGDDVRIILVRPTNFLPEGLPLINGQHVRREDYDGAARDDANWDDADNHRRWIGDFTSVEVAGLQRKKINGFRYPVQQVNWADGERTVFAYWVSLPKKARSPQLFVSFEFSDNVRNMEQTAIRSLQSITPVYGREVKTSSNRRFQNRRVLKDQKALNPKLAEARQRVIANISNLKDWWYVETPNYVLTSNLSRQNRKLVDMIQSDIETLRRAYGTLFEAVAEIEEVSVIRVFSTRKAYQNYIDPSMAWSHGVWMPAKKELVISPVQSKGKSKLPEDVIMSSVYHEGMHQYLHYAFAQIPIPIWLDEGHAAMFESAEMSKSGKRLRIRENKSRHHLLEPMLKTLKPTDLERMLTMSRVDFYLLGQPPGPEVQAIRQQHYSLAWALVYFLRKAGPLYKDKRYEGVCEAALTTAVETKGDLDAAKQAALAKLDMARFHKDFVSFWKSSSKRSRAERNRLFRK